MTLFEYLSVAVSIVLSLSAAQVLDSLRRSIDPATRDPIHVGWVAILLMTHIVLWWEFWAFRDVTNWTLPAFALVLINPGLLYVSANALVVRDPGDSRSWKDHFQARRGSIFVPFALLLPLSIVRDRIIIGTPFALPRHLPELAFTTLFLIAWRAEKRRTHAIVLALTTLLMVTSIVFAWLQPGGGSRV